MYYNNINLYKPNNVNFKQIKFTNTQDKVLTNLLTSYANITNEVAKINCKVKFIKFFKPFIQKEANKKSRYNMKSAEKIQAKMFQVLDIKIEEIAEQIKNCIKILGRPSENLCYALNHYELVKIEPKPKKKIQPTPENKEENVIITQDVQEICSKAEDTKQTKHNCFPSDEEKKQIKQLFKNGISPENLAKKFDYKVTTIWGILEENPGEIEQLKAGYYEHIMASFTPEDEKQIKQLFRNGMTTVHIAEKLDYPIDCVVFILNKDKKEFEQLLKEHRNSLFEHTDEIIQLYRQGEQVRDIAKQFYTTKDKIRAVLPQDKEELHQLQAEHEKNVKLLKVQRDNLVIQLHNEGKSAADIAKQVNCSVSTVNSILQKVK